MFNLINRKKIDIAYVFRRYYFTDVYALDDLFEYVKWSIVKLHKCKFYIDTTSIKSFKRRDDFTVYLFKWEIDNENESQNSLDLKENISNFLKNHLGLMRVVEINQDSSPTNTVRKHNPI